MGSMNQAGMISKNRTSVSNWLKYRAGAANASTAAWLVDCGIPAMLEMSIVTAMEKRAIDTIIKVIYSGWRMPPPIVPAVFLPATNAPMKTIMPNRPGMIVLRMTFAP